MKTFVCWLSLLGLGMVGDVEACCAVAPRGVPVVNADQTVIIAWDKERQMEHFIRKASFRSGGESVGFLVPTPGRPQLEESGNEAFPLLADITAPKMPAGKGFSLPIGCAAASSRYGVASVRVIEQKTVAGFQTVVLAADSGKALVAWLREHGYAYTPEAAVWAEPYLAGGWFMTAMKIAKAAEGRLAPAVAASALRISFKTDRPLFPYREPDSRVAAKDLGVKDRLLRIYFVAEARYAGSFPSGGTWSGVPRWSGPLSAGQRGVLLHDLALPESTGPAKFWLTEFEDHWPYGQAPGDVFFAPAAKQDRLERQARAAGVLVDPTLALAVGVVLVRPLLRRRKQSGNAQ